MVMNMYRTLGHRGAMSNITYFLIIGFQILCKEKNQF